MLPFSEMNISSSVFGDEIVNLVGSISFRLQLRMNLVISTSSTDELLNFLHVSEAKYYK